MTTIALLLALQAKDPEVATVSLDVRDLPLGKVLELITKETGIPIELDADVKEDLDLENEIVSIRVEKLPVLGAVKLLLGPQGFVVKAVPNVA